MFGVRGVLPTEGDVALLKGDESAVGDGDAAGVAAEIAQRVLRSAKGRLGTGHPVVAEQRPEPQSASLILVEGGLQSGDELAAKDPVEHRDRQEEAVT